MKIIIILAILSTLLAWSGLNAAKYAGEIFQMAPGVAHQAMGNTGLTWSQTMSAAWWNPALLSSSSHQGAELMHVQHFNGLMQQNQVSAILGSRNRTGIVINHLGIDRIKLTKLENPADTLSNANRPIVWNTVSNNDFILYVGLSRRIGNGFSVGLTPKLAYRSLAGNNGYGFGADIGLLTELEMGLSFGANLRDFFSTQILWENGTHEIAIPNLDLETAYRFAVFNGDVPVHLALRSQIHAEDREEAATTSFGVFSADFHAGLCVQPIPQLLVMGGYDIDSVTAGIGLRLSRFMVDFAWRDSSPDGLGSSQRVSMGLLW